MKKISRSSKNAVKITGIYLIISGLWIFLSDRLLGMVIKNSQLLIEAQTYKGWFFVLVTSVLLFYLIRESTSSLVKSRDKTEAALQEKKVLLTELHHRVKNNLAIICSLIDLQLGSLDQGQAKALLETQYRIYTLADIEELFYQNEDMSRIPFHEYLKQSVAEVEDASDGKFSLRREIDELYLNIDQAVPLGLLFNEIFSQLRIAPDVKKSSSIDISLIRHRSQNISLRMQFDGTSTPLLSRLRGNHIEATLLDLYTQQLQATSRWIPGNGGLAFELDFKKSEKQQAFDLSDLTQ